MENRSVDKASQIFPANFLSARFWAVLVVTFLAAAITSVALVGGIDALGRRPIIDAVDWLFPDAVGYMTLIVSLGLAGWLPPPVGWQGPPTDMSRFGYHMTWTFTFALWGIGSSVAHSLLIKDVRFDLDLVPSRWADLVWLLHWLLGTLILIGLSLRDAKIGWWPWLRGNGNKRWQPDLLD